MQRNREILCFFYDIYIISIVSRRYRREGKKKMEDRIDLEYLVFRRYFGCSGFQGDFYRILSLSLSLEVLFPDRYQRRRESGTLERDDRDVVDFKSFFSFARLCSAQEMMHTLAVVKLNEPVCTAFLARHSSFSLCLYRGIKRAQLLAI